MDAPGNRASAPPRRARLPVASSQRVTPVPRFSRQISPDLSELRERVYERLLEVWPEGPSRGLTPNSFETALLWVLEERHLPPEAEETLLNDLHGEILTDQHDWSLIEGTGFLVSRFSASASRRYGEALATRGGDGK
jgi:hypothetical protein